MVWMWLFNGELGLINRLLGLVGIHGPTWLVDKHWVMPAMVIMGATGPAIFINFVVALIQEHTDPRLMGRVMSVYGLSFTSSLPIGFGQAALTSTLFGPRVSLMISGLVCFAIGVACFSLMRGVRRLS